MITLPIKKKWFDMILSGEKEEEYREIKPYYTSRFHWKKGMIAEDVRVKLINGYGNDKPYAIVRCFITIGKGKTKWGAEKNKKYYVLEIEQIYEVGNIR